MTDTATATAKAPAKAARKAKAPAKAKTTAKAPAKTKAAPKALGRQGTVTIKDKAFVYGAEGSERRKSWDALTNLKGTKTLAAYKAAGGKTKYLNRWVAAGAIAIKAA
jgi:hypothetical protein